MILVMGVSGFVGGSLVKRLAAHPSFNGVMVAVCRKAEYLPQGVHQVSVGDLLPTTD